MEIKSITFWNVTFTDVSEERTTSVFKVDKQTMQEFGLLGLLVDPEKEGNTFLRNVSQ
jgi:hypothetical protein